MASPAGPRAKRIAAAPPPSPINLLTDDLLADILLRLPTLADVGRAAASYTAFRRATACRTFRHRLRSVHRAPILGLINLKSIQPAEPPHSSAPYARAFAGAADLSFSFLPDLGPWFPLDARDGRFLLNCIKGFCFALAVCDPLSRRYFLLPEIPEDPALYYSIKPFLVPVSNEEVDASFRVVCTAQDAAGRLVASVFSSITGQWSSLAIGASVQPSDKLRPQRSYAYGCFYWKVDGTDNLVSFDTSSMEFSLIHLPFTKDKRNLVIVEAGEGRLGMFTLDNSFISAVSRLIYAILEIDEDGSSRWDIKSRVTLPSQYEFSFEDATDRYLLLRGTPWNLQLASNMDEAQIGYFSFEFESMQIEKMYAVKLEDDIPSAKLYAGFPPSLSLPSM